MPRAAPAEVDPISSSASGLDDPFPDYVIGPQDELSVIVFREPDLSLPSVLIDSSGRFEMALIGTIKASGKTPDTLSREITNRFGDRYLVNPSVAVNIAKVNSKRVTVEGALNKPGIFELASNIDLISVIAMAGGPRDAAKLSEIAVFRKINGQSTVAVFDYARIRSGEAANPEIKAGDIVVVGFSGLKTAFQEFLRTAPLLGVFTRF
ncbi:MAG: polysaccharide biosynthesis/export family protein [Sphingorhabdus sp.]